MTRRNHGRRADANRHDTYITPPCAALAVRQVLPVHTFGPFDQLDVLDPFGRFGSLLAWAGCPRERRHIIELDDRPEQRAEAARYVDPERTHYGDTFRVRYVDSEGAPYGDSFRVTAPRVPWITNPPFSRFADACRLAASSVRRARMPFAALLGPIQPWHSQGYLDVPAPALIAALTWRPDFAAGFGFAGADASSPSQSYAWHVYLPDQPHYVTAWVRVMRPDVPPELVAEHARLARIAAEWPAVSPAPLLEGAT